MTLESLMNSTGKGLRWYGRALKNNYKQLIPALIAASVGAYLGQEAADRFQVVSEWGIQTSGYVGASILGWGTYLPLEYQARREEYPNGFFSREMGKKLIDVFSSDYIADAVSFAPVFVATNHKLLEKGFDAGVSGLISGGV